MKTISITDIGIGAAILVLMLILYQGELFDFTPKFGVATMEER